MKTFYNKKENKYYPENGWDSIVRSVNGIITQIFIRGNGWKKITKTQLKHWEKREIPDLDIAKVHPRFLSTSDRAKFRQYCTEYSLECAQEFMWTCDIMKGTEARSIITDPVSDALADWFLATFKRSIYDFRTSILAVMGCFSFDIIQFETFLTDEHGYGPLTSISDFCKLKFGEESVDKIKQILELPFKK